MHGEDVLVRWNRCLWLAFKLKTENDQKKFTPLYTELKAELGRLQDQLLAERGSWPALIPQLKANAQSLKAAVDALTFDQRLTLSIAWR